MKTSCPSTVALPAVEECEKGALVISDWLLEMCVVQQCSDITVTCSEETRRECLADSEMTGATTLAITKFLTSDRQLSYSGLFFRFGPKDETHWCEEPATPECVLESIIHELAHSCGWDHKQGMGVPGQDPPAKSIPACQCVDEDGRWAPCE